MLEYSIACWALSLSSIFALLLLLPSCDHTAMDEPWAAAAAKDAPASATQTNGPHDDRPQSTQLQQGGVPKSAVITAAPPASASP